MRKSLLVALFALAISSMCHADVVSAQQPNQQQAQPPAAAQQRTIPATTAERYDRDPTFEKDVTAQPIMPAPDNGRIYVRFGLASLVYFKHAIKTVKLDDPLAVRAVPQSDHVIMFTGLAPGTSNVTIESTDGRTDQWGIVTVVNNPHEVRIFRPEQINKQTGEVRSDSTDSTNGFLSLRCNEIKCDQAIAPRALRSDQP